jgi:hypothetical protein
LLVYGWEGWWVLNWICTGYIGNDRMVLAPPIQSNREGNSMSHTIDTQDVSYEDDYEEGMVRVRHNEMPASETDR